MKSASARSSTHAIALAIGDRAMRTHALKALTTTMKPVRAPARGYWRGAEVDDRAVDVGAREEEHRPAVVVELGDRSRLRGWRSGARERARAQLERRADEQDRVVGYW